MITEIQERANHRKKERANPKSIRGSRRLKNQYPGTHKSLECSKNPEKADVTGE